MHAENRCREKCVHAQEPSAVQQEPILIKAVDQLTAFSDVSEKLTELVWKPFDSFLVSSRDNGEEVS